MKKIFLFMMTIIALPIMVSCKLTPTGESIEECRGIGQCTYLDKDVRTEGSDMSNALKLLLQSDLDEMIFSYWIDPGSEGITITYYTHEEISISILDALMPLLEQIESTVSDYYDIENINCVIVFEDKIKIRATHSANSDGTYIMVDLEYDYSSDDTEQYIIDKLEEYTDIIEILIDSNYVDEISWYGAGTNVIKLIIGTHKVTVVRYGNTDSEVIDTKITQLLNKYTVEFNE